jgi:hypothetical protein
MTRPCHPPPGPAASAAMKRRWLLASPLSLLAPAAVPTTAHAAGAWPRDPAQGALLVGRLAPGSQVSLDGRAVSVGPAGEVVIGFGRDAAPQAELRIAEPGRPPRLERLAIRRRQWQVQHINGLPQAMVTPPDEVVARIQAEQARLNAIRRPDTPITFFAQGMAWPARGRISGVFGSQRILNGQPRAPHLGLDVAIPTGTPIHASMGGRVSLAQDLYFTGNTVVVDHGHGVATLHAHMSRMDVAEGQPVGQGEPLGLSGATGRVTGPHLHFALFWFATPVDPQPLLPPAG